MSTVIDSLQIDIQSNSTTAASGIDALANSLGKLKNNGAFKTVVNNLNGLSDSLKKLPNVHSASNALRTLANSIEKLKGVGTVSGLTNSLAKLPTALKSLENINIDRVAPQIQRVADAFVPLSSVKAGGLGTAVNALSKLQKVTDSLDDDAIEAFAKKIEILVEKITPLSQKMTTIQAGFKGMNSAIKQTNVTIDQANAKVNVGIFNFANLATSISAVHSALQTIIQGFSAVIAASIEWDGIAARFGRGFGSSANETYAWIQRLNEEMGINIQQFMQYSSVYATMLTGFGVESEDAGKMALGYMELTYDIWAGYNDIYGSLADTAEAVRSAIAGEVEPIRRAGFTIIESTLEQTAKNHGLAISLETATEAQKSYLRYLTLVDQAHSQSLVGTYAKEMNTAEGMLRTLSQQFKSLTQALGSLFLPILVKVLPYVQAFVELLTEGVHWLGSLLGIEIQDISNTWGDFNTGAGDANQNIQDIENGLNGATKAAKELKNATLGIDELNVISPPTASSSSGGSGGVGGAGAGFEGLDIDSLWDETIFDTIQSDVDAIKEKMRGWLPVIGAVATALAGLSIAKLIKETKIIGTLVTVFTSIGTAFKFIKSYIAAVVAHIPEVGTFAAIFPKLSTWLSSVWGWLIKIADWVTNLAGPWKALIVLAIVAITSAVYFLYQNWDEFVTAVKEWFSDNILSKFEKIGEHFENMGEALEPIGIALKPIVDWCRELIEKIDWGKLKGFLSDVLEGMGYVFTALLTSPILWTFETIVSTVENAIQMISGFIQTLRGFADLMVALFSGDKNGVFDALDRMTAGIKDYFSGWLGLIIDPIINIYNSVIKWFADLYDVLLGHSIIPDIVDGAVEWFTSLPGKILGSIEKFVTGIVSKFEKAWKDLQTWWSSKPTLKEYAPSIGNIQSKLSSAWNTAKTWWNDKKSALKEYTPSIGSIYNKVKDRWDNARTWWNDKKTKMKEYTPSIGSIYEKAKDRWDNARNWWNSKKSAMKTYTPSIGSIKDKVQSAWNSAKTWWNKNVKLSTKLDIKVPKIKVQWETASAFGKSFKYPTGFKLDFAAAGGVFDMGSLIWAGERGPEILANAGGGRTGVMNVQQMQDAVYEGVYAAVSAAMRGSNNGGAQEVNVYLDGRQIEASVTRVRREKGASLIGYGG